MKQSIQYLRMTVLVVLGAILSSCEKEEPAQPKDNVVVCTTSVSLDPEATKTLTEQGEKTFAEGDMIAVIYKNESSETVKAVSNPLPSGSYGHTATFSVTLVNPAPNAAVRIIYPAEMAASAVATDAEVSADATINYEALATQDGTLAGISSHLDLAVYDGTLEGTVLPGNPALKNKLAICEYTLKDNETTPNDITNTVSALLVEDGTYSYYVSRTPAAGPIFVAIRPTVSATIHYTAKTTSVWHVKTVTGKTYEANNFYPLGLRMTALPEGALPGLFTVIDDDSVTLHQAYFSKGNLQAEGTTASSPEGGWTWKFAENQWDCLGANGANKKVNGNGTIKEDGTVDLFGWSTDNADNYYGLNDDDTSNNGTGGKYGGNFKDWGEIMGLGWHTPSFLTSKHENGEWRYIFYSRSASTLNGVDNALYAKANLFGTKHGVILFPDRYVHPTGVAQPTGINAGDATSWNANAYSLEDWAKMEAAGAVFLPAAGYRNPATGGAALEGVQGYYWSSTDYALDQAWDVRIYDSAAPTGGTTSYVWYRKHGYSVRLIKYAD